MGTRDRGRGVRSVEKLRFNQNGDYVIQCHGGSPNRVSELERNSTSLSLTDVNTVSHTIYCQNCLQVKSFSRCADHGGTFLNTGLLRVGVTKGAASSTRIVAEPDDCGDVGWGGVMAGDGAPPSEV